MLAVAHMPALCLLPDRLGDIAQMVSSPQALPPERIALRWPRSSDRLWAGP
ncbi:MAG TPA: hypothetical protein VNT01_05105 [Symbiobacteriaceae bacterium]|nr:hypothetical protein [Symbiobacteriaceae bacterium]